MSVPLTTYTSHSSARASARAAALVVRPVPQSCPPPIRDITWLPVKAPPRARIRAVQPVIPFDDEHERTHRRSPRATPLRSVADSSSAPPGPTVRSSASGSPLPDPAAWSAKLAMALLEVVCGARPPTQVMRYCATDIFEGVLRRLIETDGRRRPLRVRRVRVCRPADGVAEASVVVADAHRVRAIALRLEAVDSRWVVTRLLIG
ncbi:MAG: Rv3235 family protein [Dermatophilaceae bacterium]